MVRVPERDPGKAALKAKPCGEHAVGSEATSCACDSVQSKATACRCAGGTVTTVTWSYAALALPTKFPNSHPNI